MGSSGFAHIDNLNTTQTPECSKGKYNKKAKVSHKVSPTTYIGRRMEEGRGKGVGQIRTTKA
jgi:hypothetical protein